MTMGSAVLLADGQYGGMSGGNGQDEVGPRDGQPKRRRFSAEYKLRILTEYEQLTDSGAKGALLRREGLYSSHIIDWRRSRDFGALEGLADKPRPGKRTPEQAELAKARARIDRLEDELAKHKLTLEVQGKASELLARLLAPSNENKQQP
jgi:transposase